jgi:hypothetical protein
MKRAVVPPWDFGGRMTSVARFASSLEKLTGESPWKPYAFAVAAVISALLLRELLVFTTGMNLVAALFLPAVMVTGLACGLLPGLFAAALLPSCHLFISRAATMFTSLRPQA